MYNAVKNNKKVKKKRKNIPFCCVRSFSKLGLEKQHILTLVYTWKGMNTVAFKHERSWYLGVCFLF